MKLILLVLIFSLATIISAQIPYENGQRQLNLGRIIERIGKIFVEAPHRPPSPGKVAKRPHFDLPDLNFNNDDNNAQSRSQFAGARMASTRRQMMPALGLFGTITSLYPNIKEILRELLEQVKGTGVEEFVRTVIMMVNRFFSGLVDSMRRPPRRPMNNLIK